MDWTKEHRSDRRSDSSSALSTYPPSDMRVSLISSSMYADMSFPLTKASARPRSSVFSISMNFGNIALAKYSIRPERDSPPMISKILVTSSWNISMNPSRPPIFSERPLNRKSRVWSKDVNPLSSSTEISSFGLRILEMSNL